MFHHLKIFVVIYYFSATFIENGCAKQTAQNEELKKEIENMKTRLDQQLHKIIEEKLPSLVLKLDESAKKVANTEKPLEKEFIHQFINETRQTYVDAMRDHLQLYSKVRLVRNDPKIKNDVTIAESLTAVENQVSALYNCFGTGRDKINTYQKSRATLQRKLERGQGDEALIEYDQKLIDSLLLNLEENRNFLFTLFGLAEKNMELLLMTSEKKPVKKEYMSIYN